MSDPGLTIDQRGLRTTGGRLRTYLPDELVARYQPLHNLSVSAGQADLVVARDRSSGEEVVVKLYRNAEQLDREVMERLYHADNAHVVRLIEHGETDGEPWEVQEYCPLGTLTDYRLEQGGQLSEPLARAAVKELADAIQHIHSLNITHRDLKPENILVRSLEPLDLVLTDFGVAAEQIATVQLQTVAASWVWAAPEVHTKGAVSRDIDWWAMGAIVHQLLTGRHPLSLSDGRLPGDLKVIRAGVVDGLYSTQTIANERWRDLVDGLLSYEPTQRWEYRQVNAWLNGQNPEAVRTSPVAEQLRAAKNAPPEETREHMFIWNGAAIRTGLELVQAMRAEWGQATEFLNEWPDKPLRDWLLTRPQGQVTAQVMDLEANGDGRLIRLQARFDPDGPLEFMGRSVDDDSLNAAIKAAERWSPASGEEVDRAHSWLGAIRDRHILKSIAAAVESDSARLIRADQLLNAWDQAALGFLTTVRQHVPLEQSNQAADAAEKRFKELRGFQFAAALSGDIPGDHSDRAREMASRIQGTLDALLRQELLPKSSPWASGQRVRDTLLSLAQQASDSSEDNLGLHIPTSVYLQMMDQVCAHDLAALRAEAQRIRRERVERERAEREARERAEREARERADREAKQAIERAEAEKKRLEDATRNARAGAKKWWDERLVQEERELQAAEDKRIADAIGRKQEELARHEEIYQRNRHKDTSGALLVTWLGLSALVVAVLNYASNRWGTETVAWVIGLSAFLWGGLLWGFFPFLGVPIELAKGTSAKKLFRAEKAEIDRDIAQLRPRLFRVVRIPVDRVGAVIGTGGGTIKRIAQPGVTVDIQGWHEVAPQGADRPRRSPWDTEAPQVRVQKSKWNSRSFVRRPWASPRIRSDWEWSTGPAYRDLEGDDWDAAIRLDVEDDDPQAERDDFGGLLRRVQSRNFGGPYLEYPEIWIRQTASSLAGGVDCGHDYWDWFGKLPALPPAPVPPDETLEGIDRQRARAAFVAAAENYIRMRREYKRVHQGPREGHGGIVVAVVVADSPDLANAAVQGIMSAIDSTAAESGNPAQHKGVTAKGLDRGAGAVAISAGQEFHSPVKAIVEYGAFVGLTSGVDGLLHVSKLKPLNGGQRVERVADVLRVGQVVKVRVAEVRPGPKYSLELADAGS